MTKRSLKDWAALAEIIASVAVVISLVFVAVQIQKNTAELQAAHENDLFDSIREIELTMISSPENLEAYRKGFYDPGSMSETEKLRFSMYMIQSLTIWEQAHARWRDGTMSDKQYQTWKDLFGEYVSGGLTREMWEADKIWFDQVFQAEVEAAFPEKRD